MNQQKPSGKPDKTINIPANITADITTKQKQIQALQGEINRLQGEAKAAGQYVEGSVKYALAMNKVDVSQHEIFLSEDNTKIEIWKKKEEPKEKPKPKLEKVEL